MGPTRTQILEETLARLQARVKELEKPIPAGPATAIPLHNPYVPEASPTTTDVTMNYDPMDTSGTDTEPTSNSPSQVTETMSISSDPSPSSPSRDEVGELWWELDHPPEQIANML